MICGVSLPPLTGTLVPGWRPPLGILILEDGATHVLDRDVRLGETAGSGTLTAACRDDIPAASALAEIQLAGWQPVVSSELHRICVALPGGGHVQVAPGASARLVPGAEFTVGRHRIRYESPYEPADLDLVARPSQTAVPARPVPPAAPERSAGSGPPTQRQRAG
jgi:hypothetical protein